MKRYSLNVFRSFIKNKSSFLGAVLIIALGVFIYIAMTDVLYNLQDQVGLYFQENHFAEVFAAVRQIPEDKLRDLETIDGIAAVFGRLSTDVRLLLAGENKIITLHLLAYDPGDNLNQITPGSKIRQLAEDQLLLGNKMFATYKFGVNDRLDVVIGDQVQQFYLAGTAKAPEYLYSVPPTGAQTPDSEIYDIACISKSSLERLLNKKGIVNELGFTLKKGYSYADVKYQLEERLASYGLLALNERKDQISNYMLNSEFSQLKASGTALPFIFLAVSVFMLYIVLKKMIDKDRPLLGTMKAFGSSDRELLAAYLKQSVLVGVLGSGVAMFLAIPFGRFMFGMYVDFFNLPYNDFQCYYSTRITGLLIALGTSLLATYLGVRDILRINPAEAMRTVVPTSGIMLKLPAMLAKLLNSRQKMGIRAIFRNRFRSFLIAFAVAFAFSMTAVLNSFDDVAEQMYYAQFTKIETYDLKVTFADYVGYNDALKAVKQLDYVYNAEAVGDFTVDIKNKNLSKYASLTVLHRNSAIYRIMDIHNTFYEPRADGLIVNSQLAGKLNIHTGDTVELFNVYLTEKAVQIPVAAVIDECFGGGCYLGMAGFEKYFGTPKIADAIVFKVAPGRLDAVKAQLNHTKNVAAVTDTKRTLKNYQELMKSMLTMMNLFSWLSLLAGIILIYNISNISIRERKTEFGTLMVLGATFNEISEIISFEQFINFGFGIGMGIPLSFGIRELVERIIAADTYTIDLHVPLADYLYALLACLVIMLISLWAILRHVRKIEPADILKERE
jgi:putative ABC transport system permease protein